MADLDSSSNVTGMDRYAYFLQPTTGDADIYYTGPMMRQPISAFILAEGVTDITTHWKCTQRALGANNTIDIAIGSGFIKGDTNFAQQGYYSYRTTAVLNLEIPAAPVSGSRTHRVVLQVVDKQVQSGTSRVLARCLEDTGSGTPAVPDTALTLCLITRTAGDSSVVNANIQDERVPYANGAGRVVQLTHYTASDTLLGTAINAVWNDMGMTSGEFSLREGHLYRIITHATVNTSYVDHEFGLFRIHLGTNTATLVGEYSQFLSDTDTNTVIFTADYLAASSTRNQFRLWGKNTIANWFQTKAKTIAAAGTPPYICVVDLGPVNRIAGI